MLLNVAMPPGMSEVLAGLAREVLRHQPRDIYGFAAEHFEKLIELRDASTDGKTIYLRQSYLVFKFVDNDVLTLLEVIIRY